jgi:hypothetical protein
MKPTLQAARGMGECFAPRFRASHGACFASPPIGFDRG